VPTQLLPDADEVTTMLTPLPVVRRALFRLAAVAALVVPTVDARAQADPDSVKLRNDCRLAVQVIETGQPATQRAEAFQTLPSCGGLARAAVLRLWREDALTAPELGRLLFSSRTTLSDTLVHTLLDVAQNTARQSRMRVAALAALTTIADPAVGPTIEELSATPASGTSLLLGRRSHRYSQVGREDVRLDVRAALLALLERLSGDPDPALRNAAKAIRASL
jgi:hypothetical protein